MNYVYKILISLAVIEGKILKLKPNEVRKLPTILSHRGECGKYPSHTSEAYELGAEHGEYIECDVAISKDLKLWCFHDSWLGSNTNIADIYDKSYKKTRFWSDKNRNDYFLVDFTSEQLQDVKKVQERSYRDQAYNGQFSISTFENYLNIAMRKNVSVYIESKNPEDFNDWLTNEMHLPDISMESLMKAEFENHEYFAYAAENHLTAIWQSFSMDSMVELRKIMTFPNSVYSFLKGSPLTDAEIETMISNDMHSLGLSKKVFLPEDVGGHVSEVRVEEYQKYRQAGFNDINIWTFRLENQFVPVTFENDYIQEINFWMETFPDLNGIITDFSVSYRAYFDLLEIKNSSENEENSSSQSYIFGFFTLFIYWFLQ